MYSTIVVAYVIRHKFEPDEAAIMGDFVTRGMAFGFLAGVTTALLARKHVLLRKHPNLIGFAVAGTVDAISRDYRRPSVYDKLMKLDSPLSIKARSILLSIRTGQEELPPTLVSQAAGVDSHSAVGNEAVARVGNIKAESTLQDWWSTEQMTDDSPVQHELSPSSASSQASSRQFGYPIQLPPGGPLKGTRTWDDIRRGNQSEKNSD
jgi:hypothetical protein